MVLSIEKFGLTSNLILGVYFPSLFNGSSGDIQSELYSTPIQHNIRRISECSWHSVNSVELLVHNHSLYMEYSAS